MLSLILTYTAGKDKKNLEKGARQMAAKSSSGILPQGATTKRSRDEVKGEKKNKREENASKKKTMESTRKKLDNEIRQVMEEIENKEETAECGDVGNETENDMEIIDSVRPSPSPPGSLSQVPMPRSLERSPQRKEGTPNHPGIYTYVPQTLMAER